MSDPSFSHLACPVIVLRVQEAQLAGDALADAVRDELLTAYLQSQAVHAVVDLEPVTYLSSAGIRPLLALSREVRSRGGRLVLTALHPAVEGVLTVSRLISTSRSSPVAFEKQADVPSAVAMLYQSASPAS